MMTSRSRLDQHSTSNRCVRSRTATALGEEHVSDGGLDRPDCEHHRKDVSGPRFQIALRQSPSSDRAGSRGVGWVTH